MTDTLTKILNYVEEKNLKSFSVPIDHNGKIYKVIIEKTNQVVIQEEYKVD